jgi:hypothetical protein
VAIYHSDHPPSTIGTSARAEQVRQKASGRRRLVPRDLFRRPAAMMRPPPRRPRAEIDHVIRRLDHVEVVLDDDDVLP